MLDIQRLIVGLGGRAKVAEICEVSYPAVFKWEKNGFIPSWHISKLPISEADKQKLIDLYLEKKQSN